MGRIGLKVILVVFVFSFKFATVFEFVPFIVIADSRKALSYSHGFSSVCR